MGEENFKFWVVCNDFWKIGSGASFRDMEFDDGAAVFDFFHAVVVFKQGGTQKSGIGVALSEPGVPKQNCKFSPVHETVHHKVFRDQVAM